MADLNADGRLDWAVANYGPSSVSIGFGDGMGGFPETASFAVKGGPSSIVPVDVDCDGLQDPVTAAFDEKFGTLLRNQTKTPAGLVPYGQGTPGCLEPTA